MAERTVLSCDRCGTEPAQRVRCQVEDEVHELDLCERHAKPILTLLPYGRRTPITLGGNQGYERVTWDRLQEEARSAE